MWKWDIDQRRFLTQYIRVWWIFKVWNLMTLRRSELHEIVSDIKCLQKLRSDEMNIVSRFDFKSASLSSEIAFSLRSLGKNAISSTSTPPIHFLNSSMNPSRLREFWDKILYFEYPFIDRSSNSQACVYHMSFSTTMTETFMSFIPHFMIFDS